MPLHWYCLQYQFIWTSKGISPTHRKLGISIYCIQELIQPIEAHESSGVCHEMPLVISPILKSTPNLKTVPLYQSCQWVCSNCHKPTDNQPTQAQQEQTGVLSSLMKLEILCLQTNMSSVLQADFC